MDPYLTAENWRKRQDLRRQGQPEDPHIQEALTDKESGLTGVSIGSKKLLRLLFQKKIEGVVTFGGSGTLYFPVETLGESQAAYYVFDVICLDDALVDVYIHGGVIGGVVAGGVQASLLKRRNGMSPDKIDVILVLDSVVGDVTLAYRVYRIAGLE